MSRSIWVVEVLVDGTWRFHSAYEGVEAKIESKAIAYALLISTASVDDTRAVRFVPAKGSSK